MRQPHCTPECDYDCEAWDHDCPRWCNVYGSPEKHGAKLLEVTSMPNLSYEYHMVILVEDTKGRKWFAVDAGCSCPSPFENIKKVEDMTPYHGHAQEYRDAVSFARRGRNY